MITSNSLLGDDGSAHLQDMENVKLLEKARKWRQINAKKFSVKQKNGGLVHAEKEDMPPEHLRYCIF